MDLNTALNYICVTDQELEAIAILLSSHTKKHKITEQTLQFTKTSLRLVRKINAEKHRNSAIDALCDDKDSFKSCNKTNRDYYYY